MTASGTITGPHHRPLADVGGTHRRLAWHEGAGAAIQDHIAYRCANHHWSLSIAQLQAALDLDRLVVLNDFSALALALPAFGCSRLQKLGGGKAQGHAACALIGPAQALG